MGFKAPRRTFVGQDDVFQPVFELPSDQVRMLFQRGVQVHARRPLISDCCFDVCSCARGNAPLMAASGIARCCW
jgi:hypothetical protein